MVTVDQCWGSVSRRTKTPLPFEQLFPVHIFNTPTLFIEAVLSKILQEQCPPTSVEKEKDEQLEAGGRGALRRIHPHFPTLAYTQQHQKLNERKIWNNNMMLQHFRRQMNYPNMLTRAWGRPFILHWLCIFLSVSVVLFLYIQVNLHGGRCSGELSLASFSSALSEDFCLRAGAPRTGALIRKNNFSRGEKKSPTGVYLVQARKTILREAISELGCGRLAKAQKRKRVATRHSLF